MKLTHHVTGALLALVFACTAALPAATIPEIKTPKAVAPPKVPVVKAPVVKVPTAPKVPVVKVPTAPKVPVVKVPTPPKIPVVKAPSVKVPVTPKIAKVPAVPKVPVVPKVVAAPKVVKTPAAAPKVPPVAVVKAPVTVVNTGKLNNLKQKVTVTAETSGKDSRFVNDNFGPGAGANKPGTLLENARQGSGKNDRNPLAGNPTDGMRGDRNSQVSEGGLSGGTTTTGKDGTTVTKWESGAVRVVSADQKTMTVSFPNGQVLERKDGQTTLYDPEGEPLPDDTGSSGVVTRNDIRGLNAKRNGTSEPAQNDKGGTGGPVNTGATGTGRTGSVSQPAGDLEGKSIPNAEATRKNIQIKIDSKINTGGR